MPSASLTGLVSSQAPLVGWMEHSGSILSDPLSEGAEAAVMRALHGRQTAQAHVAIIAVYDQGCNPAPPKFLWS